MGENLPEKVIDPELEKAQRSMGNRRDPDDEPEVPATEEPVAPAVPAVEPEVPATPPVEPEVPPVTPDTVPAEPAVAPIARPEAFIPLKKYHDEKRDWESKASTAEQRATEAEAKVAELTVLAGQQNGADKDKDIEEFMAATGFDRDTVDGLLKLVEKRNGTASAMSDEERAAVTKATEIVKEAELEAAFDREFKTFGEPELIKAFPDAKPEQLTLAKAELDKIAHTAENKDQPLDFLIYKNKDTLASLFAAPAEPAAPVTRRTVEPSRVGQGRQTMLTAADFKGTDADFSMLGDMDQAVRSEIIKNFDTTTYKRFIQYAKDNQNDGGVVVMRGGRKVVLK